MNKVILLAPIILGLGSGYFVSRKEIPKVDSKFNPPGWVFAVVSIVSVSRVFGIYYIQEYLK